MSRFIDADALYMDVIRRYDYCDDFIEMIEQCPTADVRENVRGEWIEADKGIYMTLDGVDMYEIYQKCSACRHEMPRLKKCNYCPNCGADMRGDEK